MRRVRWGVIGTGKIGLNKAIPAMQRCLHAEVVAIASREADRARRAAAGAGIPRAHASYEALLADPAIDAVYITLPNHLHVPWAIAALAADKHVLVEKPVGVSAADATRLLDAASHKPNLVVMEAFMYRQHPQWVMLQSLLASGRIGDLRAVHVTFSYFNVDPTDLCNRAEYGGGGLLDIGCYAVSASRLLFRAEPKRVAATADRDPEFGTDRMLSGLMDFGTGHAVFTCGTQLAPAQRVEVIGTSGQVTLEVPFSSLGEEPRVVRVEASRVVTSIDIEPCDQYALQCEAFSLAALGERPAPAPLADAVANMQVIDRLFESAATGSWS